MRKKVAIIGGGTAGLFLAAFLDTDIFEVTIFEKKSSLGRKFLVAGDGGFNLTHSEEFSLFKSRYTPLSYLDDALDSFSNADLRTWLLSIGIPTFVGSSGRVFPEKGIKPIEVLKSIEAHLIDKGVKLEFNRTFSDWDEENSIRFDSNEIAKADYTVFALGGSSWEVTGSDGSWLSAFGKKGIETVPFVASNCAYRINWTESFIQKHKGNPLKNITISFQKKTQKGEAVITEFGIEGNAIYGLSPEIQAALASKSELVVHIDFKPTISLTKLVEKLAQPKSNITAALKEELKLPKAVVDLIKITLTKEEFLDVQVLAEFIKNFPITIVDSAPMDEAISTSGGVGLNAVDSSFELRNVKDNFCIGEMLDWNAPTGGYLIQACASMGVCLARKLNSRWK